MGGSQSSACRNSNWVADGKRHLPLRAQRALKGKRVIDKREETGWVSSLLPARAAQAQILPAAAGEILCPLGTGTHSAGSKPPTVCKR